MLQFSYFLRKFALNSNILNNSHTSKQTTLLKNRIWHRCFSVNFAKFLGTPFLQNTSRRTPPMAASETCKIIILAVRIQLDINPYLSNMPNLHPLLFQKHKFCTGYPNAPTILKNKKFMLKIVCSICLLY